MTGERIGAATVTDYRRRIQDYPRIALLLTGSVGALVAAVVRPAQAGAAAAQDWPAFVLVGGLLLVGLVAQGDGLFAVVGSRLAGRFRRDTILLGAALVLVGVVSATLNLDTSVAFLTPVLVSTGRHRPRLAAPLLYGCLLLSNAGSLLLPGSNLTNLIVLGTLHLSGARFLARMALPWVAALLITAAVVVAMPRRPDGPTDGMVPAGSRAAGGRQPTLGLAAVVAVLVLMLALRSSALEVAGVGVIVTARRLGQRRQTLGQTAGALDLPVLVGLFGVAVALGTLGRAWSGPAQALGHLDAWASAGVAALAALAINNLPAASLLGARVMPHPFSVLVGLDLGPNLFVTGSLSWFLWLRAARRAGARPSISRAALTGAVAVPLSMAAALLLLKVTASP